MSEPPSEVAGQQRGVSPNFAFLSEYEPLLVRYAGQAEAYVFTDPNTALIKLRQFAELLAKQASARIGSYASAEEFLPLIRQLEDRRVVTREVAALFHTIRRAGNEAVHNHPGTRRDALQQLKVSRTLGIWFHRVFGKHKEFKPGPFIPPPDPLQAEQVLLDELKRLREQLAEQQAAASKAEVTTEEAVRAREEAQTQAETAYAELAAAMQIAEETEERLAEERQRFEQQLERLQANAVGAPSEQIELIVQDAAVASDAMDIDEADTRKLIDAQLREAGWEVDTYSLTYDRGARPQKGKNIAISEWPTSSGPADYVLFAGLTSVAVVEAKRKAKDVAGAIDQAKRYSRDYVIRADESLAGGSWSEYKIPFLFSTNGRPYLRQIETKSGIWFLDARRPEVCDQIIAKLQRRLSTASIASLSTTHVGGGRLCRLADSGQSAY